MAFDTNSAEGYEGEGGDGESNATPQGPASEIEKWFESRSLSLVVPALKEKGWDDMYVHIDTVTVSLAKTLGSTFLTKFAASLVVTGQ